MSRPTRIVLIDDDPGSLALLTAALERGREFFTTPYENPVEALDAILTDPPDVVICDLVMPRMDGFELTRRIQDEHPTLPVIVLTGRAGDDAAEAAYEAGAVDFVNKPVSPSVILPRVRRAVETAPAQQMLLEATRSRFDPHGIVGSHPRVEAVRDFIRHVAAVPRVAALVTGESGTGKNLVARAIHAESDASEYRFVEVNCAALPGNLLEAELFGYEKGAFTDARQSKKGLVEEAHEGTLFLDEIGSMPLELQAKLLTFLESRTFRRLGSTREAEVELRIVAATNTDLEAQAAAGEFREDLFYRLNVARTTLPPLREVRSDIPDLARHFVTKAAEYFRKPAPRIRPQSLEGLKDHDWPGNVRELRNVIERALIFSRGEWLQIPDPSGGAAPAAAPADVPREDGLLLPMGLTLEEVERRYIRAMMEETGGSVTDAADALGVSRKVLWSRRKKYGLLDDGNGGSGG